MSTKHSAEFKAQIALEAISLPLEELDTFANKKGVTKDEVIKWIDILKKNLVGFFTDEINSDYEQHDLKENVNLETEDELLSAAVSHGVNDDNLNFKRLFFWTISGVSLVTIIIFGLVHFAQASWFKSQNEVSLNSQYSEIKELKAKDAEMLNSFGVVNLEEGTYRIPIDQAINNIAEN